MPTQRMPAQRINASQALLSYEGTRVGTIVLRDIEFDMEGVRCNMEISPLAQIRVMITSDFLRSLQTGTLSYYTDEKRWEGDPPLKVFLLVRA